MHPRYCSQIPGHYLISREILPGNGKIFKNYKLQATNYKQITNSPIGLEKRYPFVLLAEGV